MKRKLFLAILSCFLLATTLVTSTYAWFTLNRAVGVSSMQLNVYSGDGVLVSITGGNTNYYQNLDSMAIKKAIVAKYRDLSFDESGNLYEIINGSRSPLVDSDINQLFEGIILDPVTTMDGSSFSNIEGTNITPDYGAYVSFDLYFKTSSSGSTSGSGGNVDLYFYTDSVEKIMEDGTIIKPTKMESTPLSVTLENHLNYYNKTSGNLVALGYTGTGESTVFDPITVNPADAMRFSTSTGVVNETKIYELNEGLGSYATTLSDASYNASEGSGSAYLAKYDSTKNAAYTYFKNVNTRQELNAMDFASIPSGLLGSVKNFNVEENAKICSISDSESEARVTFTFWLEGYDADCFDKIGNNGTEPFDLSVTLSFTTVYRESQSSRTIRYITSTLDTNNNLVTNDVTYSNAVLTALVNPINPVYIEGRKFMGWATIPNSTSYYNQSSTLAELLSSTSQDGTSSTLELYAVYE